MKVFFDADVLFSALYSSNTTSAARMCSSLQLIDKFSSERCKKEALIALDRLDYSYNLANLNQIYIHESAENIDNTFYKFVTDPFDAHVIQSCFESQCSILLTYNTKDFLIKEIFTNLKISVMNPGTFLHYLRNDLGVSI
jgi:predicted nucleic acid-binding protein